MLTLLLWHPSAALGRSCSPSRSAVLQAPYCPCASPPLLRPPARPPPPPSCQEPSSIEKVAEVDAHIGVAMSGLTADARTLVDHGRVEAQQHSFTYNEPMPVESLTQSLCDLALRFGEDEEEGSMVSALSGILPSDTKGTDQSREGGQRCSAKRRGRTAVVS